MAREELLNELKSLLTISEAKPALDTHDLHALNRLANDSKARNSTYFTQKVGSDRVKKLIDYGYIQRNNYTRDDGVNVRGIKITNLGRKTISEKFDELSEVKITKPLAQDFLEMAVKRAVAIFPKAKIREFVMQLTTDFEDMGIKLGGKPKEILKTALKEE